MASPALLATLTLFLASNEPLNVDPNDVDLVSLSDAPDVDGLPQSNVKLISDGIIRRCQGGAVALRAAIVAQRALVAEIGLSASIKADGTLLARSSPLITSSSKVSPGVLRVNVDPTLRFVSGAGKPALMPNATPTTSTSAYSFVSLDHMVDVAPYLLIGTNSDLGTADGIGVPVDRDVSLRLSPVVQL